MYHCSILNKSYFLKNALKLPKVTTEQQEARENAMREANKNSIQVPMSVLQKVSRVWDAMEKIAKIGNINCKSDIQVSKTSKIFLGLIMVLAEISI